MPEESLTHAYCLSFSLTSCQAVRGHLWVFKCGSVVSVYVCNITGQSREGSLYIMKHEVLSCFLIFRRGSVLNCISAKFADWSPAAKRLRSSYLSGMLSFCLFLFTSNNSTFSLQLNCIKHDMLCELIRIKPYSPVPTRFYVLWSNVKGILCLWLLIL